MSESEHSSNVEKVDDALKAVFELCGLSALCADICSEWGVESRADLAFVTTHDVHALPEFIKLKPVQKRKLLAVVGESRPMHFDAAAGSFWSSDDAYCPARQPRIFLGYRVSTDAGLVERLHDKLKAKGVDVWWDRKCLERGQLWADGIANGLCGSDVFVPVLSRGALGPCAELEASSRCDNVVLEHQLALELKLRGDLRAICPVLVGDVEEHPHLGDIHGDFFAGGGKTKCRDEVVEAVDAKLAEHLQRMGKGAPQRPVASRTVEATLNAILEHQGEFVKGTDAVEAAAEALVHHCRSTWKLDMTEAFI